MAQANCMLPPNKTHKGERVWYDFEGREIILCCIIIMMQKLVFMLNRHIRRHFSLVKTK